MLRRLAGHRRAAGQPGRRPDPVAVRAPPPTSPGRRGSWRRPPRCSAATAARFADLAERAAARFRAEYVTPERPGGLPVADGVRAGAGVRPARCRSSGSTPAAARRAGAARRLPHRHRVPRHAARHRRADRTPASWRPAYELLLQRENPSWLYPVTMGATTIWERWDSMLPDGSINPGEMTSFNHYAFGAVADWLHRTVAGLAPAAPGYRRLRIAPRPGPGDHLGRGHARDAVRDGRGLLDAVDGTAFALEVTVPPNTTAEVVAARRQRAGRGRLRPALLHRDHRRSRCRSRSRRSSTVDPEAHE